MLASSSFLAPGKDRGRCPTSAGFSGRKALSGMGTISTAGVLRLRATIPVSRDKYVRRSAQDDYFAI
jgi:hypothetical protein